MFNDYDTSWSLSLAIEYLDYVINNVESCANQASKDTFIDDAYTLYELLNNLNKAKVQLYDLNCCGSFKKSGG